MLMINMPYDQNQTQKVLHHSESSPQDVIRIFIGASEKELVPLRVLEYTIKRHISRPVEVFPLCMMCPRLPDPPAHARTITNFSYQRFLIPEICRYQGKAIYMDNDMLVFSDMAEIWDIDMADHEVVLMRDNKTSVMLLDCAKLTWYLPTLYQELEEKKYSYFDLMNGLCVCRKVRYNYDPRWNMFDIYTPETKLLHYTHMKYQPWIFPKEHPNGVGPLWFQTLREAYDAGFISKYLVKDHVERRWLVPKCLEVLESEEFSHEMEKEAFSIIQFPPAPTIAPAYT